MSGARVGLALAGIVGVVVAVILVVDVAVIPRIAAEDCYVQGRAATALGVEEGARVDPDSGGCEAYGCADIVVSADRLLLPDYRTVEEIRNRC